MVILVVGICALYASPNLYGEDHAVQISAGKNAVVNAAVVEKVTAELAAANISSKSIVLENEQILVRLNDSDTQLIARERIEKSLGDDYFVAMNLAPDTPS
jgi:preprotein translocase subunit SecD